MAHNMESDYTVARFTVAVSVGGIALVVAIILSLLFYFIPAQRDLLKFVAALAAAVAAVTSTFYIGQNLKSAVASEKIDRTISYIRRWNEPSFYETRMKFREIMEELIQASEQPHGRDRLALINDVIENGGNSKYDVISVLNFWEEMAIMVNRGIIDEEILKEAYKTLIIKSYSNLEPWIRELRTKRGERLLRDLSKLYDRWSNS